MNRTHVSTRLFELLERELGDMGLFILKKQCREAGIIPNKIKPSDIPHLEEILRPALSSITSPEKIDHIIKEMHAYDDIEEAPEKGEEPPNGDVPLGESLINNCDWPAAERYYRSMFREGKGTSDKKKQILALRKLGVIAEYQGKFTESSSFFQDALHMSESLKDYHEIATTLVRIAHLNWKHGSHGVAQAVLEKAQTHARRSGSKSLQGKIFLEMANLYHDQGRGNMAKDYYRKSIDLLKGDETRLLEIARAYNNMGDTYLRESNYDRALEYFKKGSQNANTHGNLNLRCFTLYNMAETLARMGNIKEGKKCLEESEKLMAQGSPFYNAQREYCRGLFFAKKGQKDQAVKTYHEALENFENLSFPVEMGMTLKELGIVYLMNGDLEKAREFFEKAKKIFATHHVQDEAVRIQVLLLETELDQE